MATYPLYSPHGGSVEEKDGKFILAQLELGFLVVSPV